MLDIILFGEDELGVRLAQIDLSRLICLRLIRFTDGAPISTAMPLLRGNYYWVPGIQRQEVKILQYSDRLKIYLAPECLADYPLPADGVTNQRFSPPELPTPPCQPKNRRYPSTEEEKRLRALDPEVSRYLDFVLESKTVQRHVFLKRLLALSRRMTPELFVKSVQRAYRYRINSLETIERIALLHLAEGTSELPFAELDEGFRQRSTYQENSLTDPPDLSIYQDPADQNHE